MSASKYFVIDFDSTFTQVEALDILGEISLNKHSDKKERLQKIKDITDLGMEGKIKLKDSIQQRIEVLDAHEDDLAELIARLKKKVSKSFERNSIFLSENKDNIYIISNGFKEFVAPIVKEYGIDSDHVFANSFTFDHDGNIIGFDDNNLLASNKGKVKTVEGLALQGEVYVIGDGHTDYEMKEAGVAQKFYAFTENVERESVKEKADHIAPSLDEFLYLHKMNKVLSYPKNRIKVLLLENVHEHAAEILKEEGYTVETYPAGLDEEELKEKIRDVSILGIRSKTQVTAEVLEEANRLLVIGAFCIGTNQIDLAAASNRGISVFNAPYSNTRSVVELAISEIIMLMRNLPDKIARMHEGSWKKSASGSFEIRGKKLGIIGYGNIGSQLSVLAEAMGLKVYYYDLEEKLALGNATKCKDLNELLETVDIVSLHVDGRASNVNMIGLSEFKAMKKGMIFVNLSRGHVVDIKALRKAIEDGTVKGTAIDVFPEEPKSNNDEFISELRGLPNTILTPHIGGSTQEAQKNIATYVPEVIIDFINSGTTINSVNIPKLQLPKLDNAHRLIHMHHNKPGVLAAIDKVLANHHINIVGQYLKTDEQIGYVITDINKKYPKEAIKDLKAIPGSIRVRVLY